MLLNQSLLENVLQTALENGADFAEVYAENTYSSDFTLKDKKPSEGITGRLMGAGIRLFYGTEVIYTYTNDISEKALIEAARIAATAINGGRPITPNALKLSAYDSIHTYKQLPWEVDKAKKISYLERADKAARKLDSHISQVMANLSEVHKNVLIANSEGLLTQEDRQYSNFSTQVIYEKDGVKERGYERNGKLVSSEYLETLDIEKMAAAAVESARTMATAEFAPAGEMPVVIDEGFGGVIFHEACGHGLETTSVAKNASVFCGKLGEKIADDCVTAIDDGTIPNEYGSLSIDDEGAPTQKTTLIENGVLKSYIVDKIGGLKTGYAPTGSGRRQDYRFAPTSRMRNTFIAPGDSHLEEMIKDIDHGLYAKKMGGGSVTPGTGAYNFAVVEGYMIKNGKVEKPVKGASLIGTGIETLGAIRKVGQNFSLAAGTCGSVSGAIPTTVGQPAILVEKLTVGGRA